MNHPQLLKKLAHSEQGFALATTLGAVLLVTAIGIASYFIAQNSIGQAIQISNSNRAYQTAVSALEYELSRMQGGKELISQTGKTLPTGESYDLTVTGDGIDMLVSTKVVLDGKTEIVSRDLTVMNFSNGVYSGAGNIFKGPAFNSPQSMLIGQAYFKLNKGEKVNSSVQFIDGPLFVEGGRLEPKGGVSWKTVRKTQYVAYSTLPISGLPAHVAQKEINIAMNPPVLTADMLASFKAAAQTNGKYYSSSMTLGNAGDTYQPNSDGIFKASGVIFVEGSITVPESIRGYEGNFVLFATDGIIVQGRLVPKAYANNLSNPPVGSFDADYYSSLGVRLPRVSSADCAVLITPKSVTYNWTSGNNKEPLFSFCGAVFSGGTINFKESLRGTIIGSTGLVPNKKTILAAQSDLSDSLPEIVKQLFNNVLAEGEWYRRSY